ncbi:hypothetical protein ACFQE1_21675, partial [Halobium palmae]
MSVLRSLRRGVGAVVGNPSMFAPAAVLALLGLPPLVLLVAGRTLLSSGYQFVLLLVAPLFLYLLKEPSILSKSFTSMR